MARKAKFILVVGRPESGKTYTVVNKIIPHYLKCGNRVVAMNPGNVDNWKAKGFRNFGGIRSLQRSYRKSKKGVFVFSPKPKYGVSGIKLIEPFFRFCYDVSNNSLLVLDDITAHIRGNIPNELNSVLQTYRHRGNDMLLIYHSLAAVPPSVLNYANELILHKGNLQESVIRQKYSDYERVIKAQKYVNASYDKYPNIRVKLLSAY